MKLLQGRITYMGNCIKKILCLFILLIFPFCNCTEKIENLFKEPDITPVRNVLKVAMPLAYTANLTMAALRGEKLPNVTIARTGSDTLLNLGISL